ncbi:MAG: glycoside hydrolase family 125 protein [Clostridiales bacterium]|nr:glycoside hydrolase family 125 protein [Clostridiales bacterium]
MERYQVTGNEFVSLPTIRERDGAVEGITFLYMAAKGLLEIHGDEAIIAPYLIIKDREIALKPQWERGHYWIPRFTCETEDIRFTCTYLTPIGERAFAIRLQAINSGTKTAPVSLGLKGCWDRTLHEINETTEIPGGRECHESGWNHLFIWTQKAGLPLFSFAPIVADNQPFSSIDQDAQWTIDGFSYTIHKDVTLAPADEAFLDVFFGVGYEQVAAATSAKELLRQGFDASRQRTVSWLSTRERRLDDPKLMELLNTNLFFAFFYASGRTIDTEELCLMTSRSPRYYVSAAYWDRDSLLWAFPALLAVDPPYAREALEYVFTRQARNFGVHSRYIDGTVLEPGFELDELCAPVIALQKYVMKTRDDDFAKQPFVQNALRKILQELESKKHPALGLYETFLQPTDDLRKFPYLTYDNALVCYTFSALAQLMGRPELENCAQTVHRAIYNHCVREVDDKRFFAWSVDEKGNYDIYDEPPGSLQLLPHYGFCRSDDEIWQNTVAMIRDKSYPLSFADAPIAEIGCKHAPHPWILSICNSLLSGHVNSALEHLCRTTLDNGIACESVNEYTGECETGEAFATCAGFLAYALLTTFYE